MAFTPYRRIQTTDATLNRIQDGIAAVSKQVATLSSQAIADAVLLTKVTLLASPSTPSGYNEIRHNLGQVVNGWIIVRQRGAASVYDQQDANTKYPNQLLYLVTSANVTVDLLVF